MMRILILNWRDIKNPKGGGAEILTHEVAKRLVKRGHSVIWFSSRFPKSKKEEVIDGVKIVRRGFPDARYLIFSVHFLAFFYYIGKLRGKIDLVIDEIHGLPFFTPWYVKEKKIALICEVADKLWIKMFGVFFGTLGRLTEKYYLNFAYKKVPFLAISQSTKNDLIKEGVPEKKIKVLPMGITFPKDIKKARRENDPTLIFVGRLSPAKGIKDALLITKKLREKMKIKLWVVGKGKRRYEKYLRKLTKNYKIQNSIVFWGFVPERKKFELLSRAHILIAPSMKEGWGLTVPEAGLVGTPSVGYDVEGLREVIKDKETGFLTKKNNIENFSIHVSKLLNDRKKYRQMSAASKKLSNSYSWENTTNEILKEVSL